MKDIVPILILAFVPLLVIVEFILTILLKLEVYLITKKFKLVDSVEVYTMPSKSVIINLNKLPFRVVNGQYKLIQSLDSDRYLMLMNIKVADLEQQFTELNEAIQKRLIRRTFFETLFKIKINLRK